MKIRYLAFLILFCVLSGCSFYDVATLAADAATGKGLFSDEHRNDDDWDGLWDPETSTCIRDEKDMRRLAHQLGANEEGKYSVVLPTGEEYTLNESTVTDEPVPGPTATCLERFDE